MTKRKEIAGITLYWLTHEQIVRLIKLTGNIDERTRLKQWLFGYLYTNVPKNGEYVPENMLNEELMKEINDEKSL